MPAMWKLLVSLALLPYSLGFSLKSEQTNLGPLQTSCQSLNVTLDVTSTNVKINLPEPKSTTDLIGLTERIIALNGFANISKTSTSGSESVSGHYSISAQLCVPQHRKTSTVQFLIHGIGFDKSYWNFPLHPETYRYVQAANEAGYTTFAIDRLGVGESSRPDPISAVQIAAHIEVVKQLTEKLRQGTTGFKNVGAFEKVVHVGHSFGSAILNGLVAEAPEISDGLVLTGYSHNASGLPPFFAANMFDMASNVDASRFSALSGGYILPSSGVYGTELAFFHVGGFDQQVADLATKTAQTATIGEIISLGLGVIPAPEFKGPVLTITGQNDLPFCANSCFGEGYPYIIGQEAQFWPVVANFTAFSPLNTGHGLNLHFSAASSYKFITTWLEENGL